MDHSSMDGLQGKAGDLGSRLTGIAGGLRGLNFSGNALGPIGMFAVPALNASNDHAVAQADRGVKAFGDVQSGIKATATTAITTDQGNASSLKAIDTSTNAKPPPGQSTSTTTSIKTGGAEVHRPKWINGGGAGTGGGINAPGGSQVAEAPTIKGAGTGPVSGTKTPTGPAVASTPTIKGGSGSIGGGTTTPSGPTVGQAPTIKGVGGSVGGGGIKGGLGGSVGVAPVVGGTNPGANPGGRPSKTSSGKVSGVPAVPAVPGSPGASGGKSGAGQVGGPIGTPPPVSGGAPGTGAPSAGGTGNKGSVPGSTGTTSGGKSGVTAPGPRSAVNSPSTGRGVTPTQNATMPPVSSKPNPTTAQPVSPRPASNTPPATVPGQSRRAPTPGTNAPPANVPPSPAPGHGVDRGPNPGVIGSPVTTRPGRSASTYTGASPAPRVVPRSNTASSSFQATQHPGGSGRKRAVLKKWLGVHHIKELLNKDKQSTAAPQAPPSRVPNRVPEPNPWADLLLGGDKGNVDVGLAKAEITAAVEGGKPAKARVLLGRLERTNPDAHAELKNHYDKAVAARGGEGKVDVPKELHFAWFGDTPNDGAVSGMLKWAAEVQATDGRWKAMLWTDESSANWDPEVKQRLTDAGIEINPDVPSLVNDLSDDVLSRTDTRTSLTHIYDQAQQPDAKAYNLAADITRYAVLARSGGVYIDVDVRPGSVSLEQIREMEMRQGDVPLFGPRLRDEQSMRHALKDPDAALTKENIDRAAEIRYSAGELGNHFIVAPPNSDFINAFVDTIPQKYESLSNRIGADRVAGELKNQAPDLSGPNVLVDGELVPQTGLIGSFTMRPDNLDLKVDPLYQPELVPLVTKTDFSALFDPDVKNLWTGLEWVTPESENQLDGDTDPSAGHNSGPGNDKSGSGEPGAGPKPETSGSRPAPSDAVPPAPPAFPATKSADVPAKQVRGGGAPPAMTPPTPESHRGKDVLTDESWRHDPAKTADWFAPENPASPDTWVDRREAANVRTVDVTVRDVTTDSTPSDIKSHHGLINYDLRRIETRPGEFVQEYTVKVHVEPGGDVAPEVVEQVKENAANGVNSLLNQGFRLPSGDRFHLNLEFTPDKSAAHTTIEVGDNPTDQTHWNPTTSPEVLAHETLHYLGVADEYQDGSRIFQQHASSSGVHQDDGGMMGADVLDKGKDPGLRPRHLWLVERTANSQVAVPDTRLDTPGPADGSTGASSTPLPAKEDEPSTSGPGQTRQAPVASTPGDTATEDGLGGTAQEQRDRVTRRELGDRIAAMGLDPTTAIATFDDLAALGSVENHVADVLSSPGVLGPVSRISAAVASLNPEQATRVRGLLTDALVTTSAVPVRHHLAGDITKLNLGHVHDWQAVRPLTPEKLERVLAGVAADVEAGRVPLPDLPHRATDPLPRRLAVLETMNLTPGARGDLFAHPPFTALLDSPHLADALFGGKGLDEQVFLNTCEPSVVNTGLRSTLPTIAAQVFAGRALADSVQRVLDAVLAREPALVAEKDGRGGRTIEQLVRDRIAEARATFDRLEGEMRAPAPDWAALSDGWGRVMQKLAAVVDPSEGAESVPVLTRKVIGGAWEFSAVLALPMGVDRPGRRATGVSPEYRYFAEQVLAGSPPSGEPQPLSGNSGQGFWARLHHVGVLPVTLPGRFTEHAVSVQAIRHEGAEAYLVGDPKKKHYDLLTPSEFDAWVARTNAEAVLPAQVAATDSAQHVVDDTTISSDGRVTVNPAPPVDVPGDQVQPSGFTQPPIAASGAPAPRVNLVEDYRFTGEASPFTGNQPMELDRGTGFPAFTTAAAPVHVTPPLRVSGDGTLAVNGLDSVRAAGRRNAEAREFFATTEVLADAREALRRAGSGVELVVEGSDIVLTDGNGNPRTLHRIMPGFEERPPDVCRDMAAFVSGSPFDAIVVRGDGRTVMGSVNSTSGLELTGTHHLAAHLADLAHGDGDLGGFGAESAAATVELDRDGAVDLPGRPRPGTRYGSALNPGQSADRSRGRLDELARRAGINQYALARPGEAYQVSSISSAGPNGGRELRENAARGNQSANPYGYHFAAVVAQSADGTQVTLENYARSSKSARLVAEAVATNLEHHGAELDQVLEELDATIEVADRQGDTAALAGLRSKRELADALRDLRDAGSEPPPAVLTRAQRAMRVELKLPRPGDQWYFRMYRPAPGETFFDQTAVLYEPAAPTSMTNPLVTAVTGGRQAVGPVSVWFESHSKDLPSDQAGGVKASAKSVAKAALWRRDNGYPLPSVTVTGSGHGGLGGARRAKSTGLQRAESVAETFRVKLAEELARLQGDRITVRPEDIRVDTGAADGHKLPADHPDVRRVDLRVDMPDADRSTTEPHGGQSRNTGEPPLGGLEQDTTSDHVSDTRRFLRHLSFDVLTPPASPPSTSDGLYAAVGRVVRQDPAALRAQVVHNAATNAAVSQATAAFTASRPMNPRHLHGALVENLNWGMHSDVDENRGAGNARDLLGHLIATRLGVNVVIHQGGATPVVLAPMGGQGRGAVEVDLVVVNGQATYLPR